MSYTLDGEQVPADQPFVLVYNQASFVDDLTNPEVLARLGTDRAVLAAEYGWIPFFERTAPRWGIVLLQRGHRDEVEHVLAELVATLKSGERVSMAPEGRVSSDGNVGHFKRGAFLVAVRAGVPVVPMAVPGATTFSRRAPFGCDPVLCATAWAGRSRRPRARRTCSLRGRRALRCACSLRPGHFDFVGRPVGSDLTFEAP